MCAYINRALLKANNITNIELVIMCDDYIYKKYKKTLQFYFDKVDNISLIHTNMIDQDGIRRNLEYNQRYSWVVYSLNKWQCLKYVEYDKILFLDVDILPTSVKFYDIFNLNTPAFHTHGNNIHSDDKDLLCKNNDILNDLLRDIDSYEDYIAEAKVSFYSADGGISLHKPNMDEYNNYFKFIRDLNDKHGGVPQMAGSGIDETTIFYYYMKHKGTNIIYRICPEYAIIPWGSQQKIDKKLGLAYNYLEAIKPWKKAKIISWPEEFIWRNVYFKMKKTKKLRKLYEENIIVGMNEFNSYNNDYKTQKRNFNVDYKNKNRDIFNKLNKKNITYDEIFNAEKQLKLDKIEKDYGYLNNDDVNKLFKAIKFYRKENKK